MDMLDTKKINGNLVIIVNELRIDMVIARKFRELLSEKIVDKPSVVVLDLKAVDYFDSSALGALVTFMKEIKGYHGQLKLCCLSRSLVTLLKLSKLDTLFSIYEKQEEATGD